MGNSVTILGWGNQRNQGKQWGSVSGQSKLPSVGPGNENWHPLHSRSVFLCATAAYKSMMTGRNLLIWTHPLDRVEAILKVEPARTAEDGDRDSGPRPDSSSTASPGRLDTR